MYSKVASALPRYDTCCYIRLFLWSTAVLLLIPDTSLGTSSSSIWAVVMDLLAVRLPWDHCPPCLSVLLDIRIAPDGQQLTVDKAGKYIMFGTYTSSSVEARPVNDNQAHELHYSNGHIFSRKVLWSREPHACRTISK